VRYAVTERSDFIPDPEIRHMATYMNQCPIEQRREEAFAQLPPYVTEFVRNAASAWGLEPALVLAGAVHHVAAALGTSFRLRQGNVGYSCPFNLLIVSAVDSRADWYEYMGEPWLEQVRKNVRLHQVYGQQNLLAELKKLISPTLPTDSAALLHPQEREVLVRQKLAVLRPCVMSRDVKAHAVVQAVEQCFDRCLLMLPGGVDPVFDLLDAGRRETAELVRILGMSWQDQDLPTKGAVPFRGMVHLGWRSAARHVRRLVLDRQRVWAQCPPPVLFILQGTTPGYLPLDDSESFNAWSALLSESFSRRVASGDGKVWTLSSESDALLRGLHREIADMPTAGLHPGWFNWLPGLAVRLALLLSGLDHQTPAARQPPLLQADTMRRACILARWLAQEHCMCLESLRQLPAVELADREETVDIDFIDMAEIKQQIVAKLTERGSLSPRDLTRSFHKLPQGVRDAAVTGLLKAKQVELLADGQLAVRSDEAGMR
jgi:hypothetical protein